MKFFLLFLVLAGGCVSTPIMKLNPAVYYENDICFTYETENGTTTGPFGTPVSVRKTKTFCGVGTLPYNEKYKLEINTGEKLDLFAITTCHREESTREPDKGVFKKDGRIFIDFVPTVEKNRACPLYAGAFNRSGKHAWGVVVMESPAYQLKATVFCNGKVISANGVFICQSRENLIQKIIFPEPVKLVKPVNGPAERKEDCPALKPFEGDKVVEFSLPNRECLYGFIGKESYKIFQLYTVGYEELIVR